MQRMDKSAGWVLRHRKWFLVLFLVLAVASPFFAQLVTVNYNMVDYLPADAPSTQALSLMESEFGGELPNTRVMIADVDVNWALRYKDELKQLGAWPRSPG